MRDNAGENSSHEIEEFIQSKDGGGDRFLQDRRDDRPLIYQYAASDYIRGSLRQIKLKLRVEGLIEVLSIKEIMERKTAKDTKVDDRTSRRERRSLETTPPSISPHSSRC